MRLGLVASMERSRPAQSHALCHDAALRGDASALCGGLADKGLRINPNQQRAFRTYVAGCNVMGRVTIVSRTGWHDIDGHRADETIGPKGSERVILNASAVGPYEARGLLANWQQGVGALSNGHALPVLAISAALAGPLLELAGLEGGGLNIFGGSSQGKTTVIQAGALPFGAAATRRAMSGHGARRPTAWRGWRRAPANQPKPAKPLRRCGELRPKVGDGMKG
jgi:putative DNA primase/helicase